MCLDSALDLWPPGHFALEVFASQIGRSEIECSALGFSYERWKPRNGQLAKMRSFHQSKRSDNKQYTVEVRWHIFLRIWRIFLFLRTVVNIPIQILIIPPWLLLRKMIISRLELGSPVHEPNCKEKEVHRPIRSTNSGLGSAVFVLSSLARFVWIYMKYIHLCYWPSVRSKCLTVGRVIYLQNVKKKKTRLKFSHLDRTSLVRRVYFLLA